MLVLQDVCKTYQVGENPVEALHGVSFRVEPGEWVAIVGSSGSGKSTLMNILGCLDSPTAGSYCLEGEKVASLSDRALSTVRNRKIGFIFQQFHLLQGLTALENVELPLLYRGIRQSQRRRLAAEALEQVGLSERMGHLPACLSGGQQQRVAIARALVGRPSLILADEPTGNLDPVSGAAVIGVLRSLHREGKTVILITHDLSVAAAANRQIVIADGRVVSDTGSV